MFDFRYFFRGAAKTTIGNEIGMIACSPKADIPPTPRVENLPGPEPHTRRIRVAELAVTLMIGGSEQLAASIGRGLNPASFDVVFGAIADDGPIGDSLRQEGRVARAFHRRPGFDYRVPWQAWRFLREHGVDVAQTHHVAALIYGGVAARLAGARLIHTEHEINTFRQFPNQIRWLRRLAFLVDRFVAIDPSIADFLESEGGIDRRRIRVIRNGVDLRRFHPPQVNAIEARDGSYRVGWIARLDPPKRPDLLVAAVQRLRRPELRVRIIGPGKLTDAVRRQIADAGLQETVELVGPRTDIADQLQGLDCYVLCSEAEGLPISLVEAMATGLPCVASSVGGIPSLIEHGKNGLLLGTQDPDELASLLERLIDARAWGASLGTNGRRTALERFDFQQTIAQYEELFREVTRP
ncbi:MAG: glycosyltransferase family 4 protein [Planctomycetota bacterium]